MIRSLLNEYWDIISEDIHAASYLLDPTTRGRDVDEAQLQDAERLIQAMADLLHSSSSLFSSSSSSLSSSPPPLSSQSSSTLQLMDEFTKFRAKLGVYSNEANDILLYWQRLHALKPSKTLATIALDILGFPQSCAAVERSFSVVRRIHTWQRNKLGRKTLAKLVYVYLNQHALERRQLIDPS
jgi:hypothetical protein